MKREFLTVAPVLDLDVPDFDPRDRGPSWDSDDRESVEVAALLYLDEHAPQTLPQGGVDRLADARFRTASPVPLSAVVR